MKKVLCFLCLFFIAFSVKAEESKVDYTLAQNAESAILIEASTGKILFEKNSHEKLSPASMTKMMSMLLVMEAIENDVIKWDDIITVSQRASSMGGSQILLEVGEKMSVEDLFKGVAVGSANDAVVALSEAVAGSVEEFVEMMNKRASELGLTDTNFKNPHGLDEVNHYSSAHDMSIIARELLKHEKVLEFSSIYEDYLRKGTDREFWLVNTNKLVRFNPIVDGLKTGYTKTAGYCLTATANKNNMRLIAVVMKEPDTTTRNSEVTEMLDYGYAKYKLEKVVDKNDVLKEIKISKAKDETVKIVPVNDVNIIMNKSTKLGNITYDLNINKITVPTKKGTCVGRLSIKENNKIVDTINVTIKEDVTKVNIFKLYLRTLKDIITG